MDGPIPTLMVSVTVDPSGATASTVTASTAPTVSLAESVSRNCWASGTAPPVTSTNQAVVQAEQDMARSNLMKKTVHKTMLAGDTGGYTMGQATAGQPSQAATTGYKGKLG